MGSFLTTRQLADRLQLAEVTLCVWRVRGKGPAWRKLGSRVLYDEADVKAWLDSTRRQSTREDPATPAPTAG